MEEIYYKRLIKKYHLWYSPEMTAKIIKEAHMYNWVNRKDLNIRFYWKDIAKEIGISASAMSRIVSGKGFPSRKTMDKLIKYLDLVV
jgi:transcriptional regulator with XRE-family HTH domain